MDGVAVFQVDGGVGFGVGKDDLALGLGVAGTLDKFCLLYTSDAADE